METKEIFIRRLTHVLKSPEPVQTLLFSKVLDRLFLCVTRKTKTFGDFYDPATGAAFWEALRPASLPEVNIAFFGGAPGCERGMLGFSPADDPLTETDFPITRLRITFNTKFNKAPRHRDLLGAVLGLGTDRSRLGDIILLENHADLFVHTEMAAYIAQHLTAAGRIPVSACIALPESEAVVSTPAKEMVITVASLRLDAVIAEIFNISRARASAFITGEKALVNWRVVSAPDKNVAEGDKITLRGFGRAHLLSVEGKTKKDRVRLRIGLYG